MFLIGLIALVTFILARPLDFVPALQGLPLLYVFFLLAVAGFVADVSAGRIQMVSSPQLGWAIAFVLWCIVTSAYWDTSSLTQNASQVLICVATFFLIGHGVQSLVAFERLALALAGCSLWVAFVCAHMAYQPTECVAVDVDAESPMADKIELDVSNGQPCTTSPDCVEDQDPDQWGVRYSCEHVGLFGLTSVKDRVRYVGVLHDPNESAMAVCLGLPLFIGLFRSRRTWLTAALTALAIVLASMTVIFSQSRGGQLVFIAVFGVYFFRTYGFRGIAILALAALPIMLLGGRSSGEADASSEQRMEAQLAGLEMFTETHLMGVGFRRFVEHHAETAHNSYILVPAELGVIGTLTWSVVMYLSWKIPISALGWQKRFEPEPDAPLTGEEVELWAIALLATQAGLAVGIFFLSFAYHFVLWIHAGLVVAFYVLLRKAEPDYRIRLTPLEVVGVVMGHFAVLAAVRLIIRIKLGY